MSWGQEALSQGKPHASVSPSSRGDTAAPASCVQGIGRVNQPQAGQQCSRSQTHQGWGWGRPGPEQPLSLALAGKVVYAETTTAHATLTGLHYYHQDWSHAAAYVTVPPLRLDTNTSNYLMSLLAKYGHRRGRGGFPGSPGLWLWTGAVPRGCES